MDRPITGFELDDEGDWVALLRCGHRQHVRHRPPLSIRSWVESPEGRAGRIGTALACSRCDRRELPDDAVAYRSTPLFTEQTIPAGLLDEHRTRAGVWGRIEVESGSLEYVCLEPATTRERLGPGDRATIVPEAAHRIAPIGPVRFRVTFLKMGAHR